MKKILVFLSLIITIFLIEATLNAQSVSGDIFQPSELPKVFLLGEYENQYNELMEDDFQTSLLTACNNDMKSAFDKWVSMLQEIEVYAESIDFDIKGVKLWIHVFWNPDGSISHIGYYLKPNSRNVKTEDLNALLSSFMNHYKFPLSTNQDYSHYSSASFPVFSKRIPE